jgi:hypothetical protein
MDMPVPKRSILGTRLACPEASGGKKDTEVVAQCASEEVILIPDRATYMRRRSRVEQSMDCFDKFTGSPAITQTSTRSPPGPFIPRNKVGAHYRTGRFNSQEPIRRQSFGLEGCRRSHVYSMFEGHHGKKKKGRFGYSCLSNNLCIPFSIGSCRFPL